VGRINVLTDTQYVPQYANGLNIDYTMANGDVISSGDDKAEGFLITSLKPVKSGCGGCGGCSGCGHKN
jgi:hypothetical protein